MNIAKNLERSAFYFPHRPVVNEDMSEISYTRFNARANRVATALIKLGVNPGDHIGIRPGAGLAFAGRRSGD